MAGHSFNKYLLSFSGVQGSVLGIENKAGNKMGSSFVLMDFAFKESYKMLFNYNMILTVQDTLSI